MEFEEAVVVAGALAGTDVLSFTAARDWPVNMLRGYVVEAPPGQVRRIRFNHPSELHMDTPWTTDIVAGARVKIFSVVSR